MGGAPKEDKTPINAELIKAGGFGRYQWFVVITMVLGMMSGGIVTHGIGYLEKPPEEPGYLCTYPSGEVLECGPSEFCNDDTVEYEVNFAANNENLYNWYTRYDLACKGKQATAMIASVVFAGCAIGCLFIPRLGDLWGRRTIFCAAMLIQAPCMIIATAQSSLKLLYVGAFILGFCIIGRMGCGFLLLMEMVPTRYQSMVGAGLMIAEGSIQILWTVYFVTITKNAQGMLWFATCLNVVTALLSLLIVESPRFLFGRDHFEACCQVLSKIARYNGVRDYEAPKFDIEYEIDVQDVDENRNTDVNRSPDAVDKVRGQTQKNDIDFNHLLASDQEDTARDKTGSLRPGGQTYGRKTYQLTKRETVSQLHETTSGLRQTAHLFQIGVDKTQSIALDELFGNKVRDGTAATRIVDNRGSTKTYRTSRVTTSQVMREGSEQKTLMDGDNRGSDKEAEEVVIQQRVMRGEGLCDGSNAVNLAVMMWLWSATTIDYFFINIYLKYVPGSDYLNFTIAGVSEILAHIVVGFTFQKLTPRWTYFIAYLIAFAGGFALIFQNKFADNDFLIAGFVLLAKFGASMAMCTCYISTPFVFPMLLCGTAFGICNLVARTMSLIAPQLVELPIPIPMIIFTSIAFVSLFASLFIRTVAN